jgi:type VI secretion system secreted protein VgrG
MIDRVLEREGGFVDNPFDKGGPTNKGITYETLKSYWGRTPTLEELRELTTETARDIYYDIYVVRPGFNRIVSDSLRELLFDAGVNHGPGNAIKMLQRALNNMGINPPLLVDGNLGVKTDNAMQGQFTGTMLTKMVAQRLRFYGNIVAKNPQQQRFAAGWFNRVADLLDDIS